MSTLGYAQREISATRVTQAVSTVARRLAGNPAGLVGIVLVLAVVLVALAAPLIAPHPPDEQLLELRRQGPSADALLGRDEYGRDILSRLIWGARPTLVAALVTVAISAVAGTALGVLAGYAGGFTGTLIMRAVDVVLSFPYFLLALLIVAIAGPGLENAVVAVAVTAAPAYARVVRASTLEVLSQDFVSAVRSLGAGHVRMVCRHVLPNVLAPIIVLATVGMATTIIAIASLSFLGLGAQPPTPEWGAMLSEGRAYISSAPHIVIFPGVAIMLAVLGFNLFGDAARDLLDPHLDAS